MNTVLIVDADLGFVFWLGKALQLAGCAAFPAQSVLDARVLIAECRLAVDVLILDPSLPGAYDFVTALRRDRHDLKVVEVSEDYAHPGYRLDADATGVRPTDLSEQTPPEWTRIVQLCASKRLA